MMCFTDDEKSHATDLQRNHNERYLLIVFSKEPMLGQVKTRLIPSLGEQGALTLYKKLLKSTLDNCTRFIEESLIHDPDKPSRTLKVCLAEKFSPIYAQQLKSDYDVEVSQQQGENLGERMANAIMHGLQNFSRVVIIGGDCVSVNAEYLAQAFSTLDQQDCVVGPAEDGGFVLIGIKKPKNLQKRSRLYDVMNTKQQTTIFSDILWGESNVLHMLLANLEKLQVTFNVLPVRWDIDEVQDLKKLKGYAGFEEYD